MNDGGRVNEVRTARFLLISCGDAAFIPFHLIASRICIYIHLLTNQPLKLQTEKSFNKNKLQNVEPRKRMIHKCVLFFAKHAPHKSTMQSHNHK